MCVPYPPAVDILLSLYYPSPYYRDTQYVNCFIWTFHLHRFSPQSSPSVILSRLKYNQEVTHIHTHTHTHTHARTHIHTHTHTHTHIYIYYFTFSNSPSLSLSLTITLKYSVKMHLYMVQVLYVNSKHSLGRMWR